MTKYVTFRSFFGSNSLCKNNEVETLNLWPWRLEFQILAILTDIDWWIVWGFLTHISNYYPYMQRNMEDYKKRKVYGETNKTFLSVFRFNI